MFKEEIKNAKRSHIAFYGNVTNEFLKEQRELAKTEKADNYSDFVIVVGDERFELSLEDLREFKNSKNHTTLDNGGLPFMVKELNRSGKLISIYKQVEWLQYEELFEGNSNGEGDIDSAILIRLKDNKYIYVGIEVFEFETDERITKFIAPIGNSAVPYPIAFSDNKAYLMLEKKELNLSDINDLEKEDVYRLFYNDKDLKSTTFNKLNLLHSRVLG